MIRATEKNMLLIWETVRFSLGVLFLGFDYHSESSAICQGFAWKLSHT